MTFVVCTSVVDVFSFAGILFCNFSVKFGAVVDEFVEIVISCPLLSERVLENLSLGGIDVVYSGNKIDVACVCVVEWNVEISTLSEISKLD